MRPNVPSTRHKNKLAITLATKQVSINMISISINGEGLNMSEGQLLLLQPSLDFPTWKVSIYPSQKPLIYDWKLRKNLLLPILKGTFEFESKVCTSLLLIHQKNRWISELHKIDRKLQSLIIHSSETIHAVECIFSENKFQLLNSRKNLFSYELQLFICFPKFWWYASGHEVLTICCMLLFKNCYP